MGVSCFIPWVKMEKTTAAIHFRRHRRTNSACGKGVRRAGLFPQTSDLSLPESGAPLKLHAMLLFREKIPADWLPKVLANLPAVLVDHAHLERKAATTALNLEKYRDLYSRVEELNGIAIEELQHFQLVLGLLKQRGIPFGQPHPR